MKKEVVRVAGAMGKVVKSRVTAPNNRTGEKVWDYAYHTTDGQGSTRQEISENQLTNPPTGGQIPKPNTYYAYGSPSTGSTSSLQAGSGQVPLNAQNQKVEDTYTGQRKDEETNLMFYNARYYNPQTGLFLQADSVDDGLNKYQYVAGNPVNNVDPSGNEGEPPTDVIDTLIRKINVTYIKNKSIYRGIEDSDYLKSVIQQYSDLFDESVDFNYFNKWRIFYDERYLFESKDRVDPKIADIKKIMTVASDLSGIPTDALLALGWRENLLRGKYSFFHGDGGPIASDGLMQIYADAHSVSPTTEHGFESNVVPFAMYGKTEFATIAPIAFIHADAEASIYAGTMIYYDALSRVNDKEYSGLVNYLRENNVTDYGIAYSIYNIGIYSTKDENRYQDALKAGQLFDNTYLNTKPWNNPTLCPTEGYCGMPQGSQ